MNIEDVYDGWKNLLWTNEEVEKIAKERLEICNKCEFKQKVFWRCKLCGCPIPTKVRSMKSKCPDGRW